MACRVRGPGRYPPIPARLLPNRVGPRERVPPLQPSRVSRTCLVDRAWDEVEFALASNEVNSEGLRTVVAVAIVARLRECERDFERLKELALEAIARIY